MWVQILKLTIALSVFSATYSSLDPCQRQPFRATCDSLMHGRLMGRSQFVLRFYRRENECVSYPFALCRGDKSHAQLFKRKEDCELACVAKHTAKPLPTTSQPVNPYTKKFTSAHVFASMRTPPFKEVPVTMNSPSTGFSETTPATKLTKCQERRLLAQQSRRPAKGKVDIQSAVIYECTPDGAFEQVQCHQASGVCWCVNEDGYEIANTRTQGGNVRPDCSGRPLATAATTTSWTTSTRKAPMARCSNGAPAVDSLGRLLNCFVEQCPSGYRCAIQESEAVCCPYNEGNRHKQVTTSTPEVTTPSIATKKSTTAAKPRISTVALISPVTMSTTTTTKSTSSQKPLTTAPPVTRAVLSSAPTEKSTEVYAKKNERKEEKCKNELCSLECIEITNSKGCIECMCPQTEIADGKPLMTEQPTTQLKTTTVVEGTSSAVPSSAKNRSQTMRPPAIEKCLLPLDVGPCNGPPQPRWGFNRATNRCERFDYTGCGGNMNHFYSLKECNILCAKYIIPRPNEANVAPTMFTPVVAAGKLSEVPSGVASTGMEEAQSASAERINEDVEPVCALPRDSGPCMNFVIKWFYNAVTGKCERFQYGSCGGNSNNFDSMEACNSRCVSGIHAVGIQVPDACDQEKDSAPMRDISRSTSITIKDLPEIDVTAYSEQTVPTEPYSESSTILPVSYGGEPGIDIAMVGSEQTPMCPNGLPSKVDSQGHVILCLPGKALCPPASSCYFNGIDFFCCPMEEMGALPLSPSSDKNSVDENVAIDYGKRSKRQLPISTVELTAPSMLPNLPVVSPLRAPSLGTPYQIGSASQSVAQNYQRRSQLVNGIFGPRSDYHYSIPQPPTLSVGFLGATGGKNNPITCGPTAGGINCPEGFFCQKGMFPLCCPLDGSTKDLPPGAPDLVPPPPKVMPPPFAIEPPPSPSSKGLMESIDRNEVAAVQMVPNEQAAASSRLGLSQSVQPNVLVGSGKFHAETMKAPPLHAGNEHSYLTIILDNSKLLQANKPEEICLFNLCRNSQCLTMPVLNIKGQPLACPCKIQVRVTGGLEFLVTFSIATAFVQDARSLAQLPSEASQLAVFVRPEQQLRTANSNVPANHLFSRPISAGFQQESGIIPPLCSLAANQGRLCNSTENQARSQDFYYYDSKQRECIPLKYAGCGGNDNRFSSRNDCYRVCHRGLLPVGN
ncbi:Putative kunitz [Trichuris trichiura]|uniref:Putative kunitz n=1 Tax=Trichuris trichiura TaxID=36087 RepID=A0A077YWB1_TRITR|nr:Putative kunitz [Trichuris trichiura]